MTHPWKEFSASYLDFVQVNVPHSFQTYVSTSRNEVLEVLIERDRAVHSGATCIHERLRRADWSVSFCVVERDN